MIFKSSIGLHSLRQTRFFIRSLWTFKRKTPPPLQAPRESPYIIGPYLKPDYVPREYITRPILERDHNDFDHFIYEPTKVEEDESRTVQLLLIDDVEGLGTAGQVVEAPFRLGASKLVAMRKAEYFTDFSKKWYKFGEKTFQSASSALSPRTARGLRSQIYDLPVAKNISIKAWHVSLALRLSGVLCPPEAVDEKSIQVEPRDDGTEVTAVVTINNHEKVEVRFTYSELKSKTI